MAAPGLVLLLLTPAASARGEDPLVVVGGLESMVSDALTVRARQLWDERDRTLARLVTPADVEARQRHVRERFLEALGGFPDRTPLRARVTGTLERDDYRVEKLVYESLPGFHVTANVYVPRGHTPPFPAVLGTAGHTANGKAAAIYQHAWISMAKKGFVVLAFDPPGQGERSLYFDPALGRSRVGIGTREHTLSGLQCLLTGHHFARYEVWDAIRGVDYLLTREDVDPARLAVAGNSGGGTQAAYLAVAEPRLSVAVSSCYMTSWKQLWFEPGPQDAEQDLPAFLHHGLDFADYATAFAPRPFLILSAVRDYFPIAGARAAHEEARRLSGILGREEAAGFFAHDDTHGWSLPRREATYRWLERWLHDRDDEGREPEHRTELESELYATPTGQVSTSFEGAETVQSLNRAVAEAMFPGRAAATVEDAEDLRVLVRARLKIGAERRVPPVTSWALLERDGFSIEKVALRTGEDLTVPALVFLPRERDTRGSAILYLHGAGKAADAGKGGDIEALVRSGHVVLAPDLPGVGESHPTRASGGYQPVWQMLQRALLVDRTIVGLQVEGLLSAFDYLAARDEVDPDRIALIGKAQGSFPALVAALLEPRVEKVALEGAVLSWLEVARAPLHENLVTTFVPGVLRDFDLPDVAAALAPRPLWLVDARSPTGALVSVEKAEEEYAPAQEAYARVGRPDALRVLHRAEGWRFEDVYSDWLERR